MPNTHVSSKVLNVSCLGYKSDQRFFGALWPCVVLPAQRIVLPARHAECSGPDPCTRDVDLRFKHCPTTRGPCFLFPEVAPFLTPAGLTSRLARQTTERSMARGDQAGKEGVEPLEARAHEHPSTRGDLATCCDPQISGWVPMMNPQINILTGENIREKDQGDTWTHPIWTRTHLTMDQMVPPLRGPAARAPRRRPAGGRPRRGRRRGRRGRRRVGGTAEGGDLPGAAGQVGRFQLGHPPWWLGVVCKPKANTLKANLSGSSVLGQRLCV